MESSMNDFTPWQRVCTFSICAVNPKTGEAGVAVVSSHVAVGAIVPYAEPGAGAVATQAVVSSLYGLRGLEMLRKKVSASEVIRRLTAEDITITADDPKIAEYYTAENMKQEGTHFIRDKGNGRIIWFNQHIRQVGVVDAQGGAAVHSGDCIFPTVASVTGEGFSCQGNMLVDRKAVDAMASAFEKARRESKTMLKSLLAAIQDGEAAGGNKRGNKAASVLVVREKGHWSGMDRFCDVRIDYDDQPVSKLAKIALMYEET
jgi:uncharacterized Ntn-hydrolase superfamily protein